MKKILFVASLATILTTPISYAYPGHGKSNHFDRKFQRMDINADGKISKNEFMQKSEGRFNRMDANNDGYITKEEANQYRQQMREKLKKRFQNYMKKHSNQ